MLDQKPVLARFFAISVLQWEQHVTELAQRLEHDRQVIVARFFGGRSPGAVAGLDFGMSDRHRDGRGVAIVRFDSGQQLVYKPRDLGIDGAWATFLQRIQAAGAPGELRTPDVLCRDGYGWTSFVNAEPCASLDEVRVFYLRAGALLALFQILGSCDFHQENVIACGSNPIPVDLETLLRPGGRLDGDDRPWHPAISAAVRRMSASVLESGYLPYWNTFRSTRWTGGGLSWSAPEEVKVTGWLHANTDTMMLGRKPLAIDAVRHLPRLAESIADPSGHLGDIDAGLVAMGRFVLAHRETVRDALAVFRDTSVRVVLRDTRFYEMLSRRAMQPTRLVDGLSASLELEFLMRFHHPVDANIMTCVRCEQAVMLRLDTPLFRMRSDGTTLHEAGSEEVEFSCLEGDVLSPMAHAAARLNAFDDAHLEQQRRLLRFAFSRDGIAPAFASDAWPEDSDRAWRPQEMVQRATRIGEHLLSLAVVSEGGATWIGLPSTAIDAAPHIQVLGENFYDGTTAIAVFLLALARATGRDDFRQTGLNAFATLRDGFVRERHAGFPDRDRILGGAEGLASCIYPLVLGAHLADSDMLLDWAEEIAQCIGDAWIGAEPHTTSSAGRRVPCSACWLCTRPADRIGPRHGLRCASARTLSAGSGGRYRRPCASTRGDVSRRGGVRLCAPTPRGRVGANARAPLRNGSHTSTRSSMMQPATGRTCASRPRHDRSPITRAADGATAHPGSDWRVSGWFSTARPHAPWAKTWSGQSPARWRNR
ncbi:type 2 lantibiotic biosynthesis protein LanM [Paraburkholderia youngii]